MKGNKLKILFSHYRNKVDNVVQACHNNVLNRQNVEALLLTPEKWSSGEYKQII